MEKIWISEQNQKNHFHKIYESENRILKAFLLQTYMIALPIFLGYIVWLLQEQKKKQATDAKERDARIAEEKEVRNANSRWNNATFESAAYRIPRQVYETWNNTVICI